ncbi:MAG: gluconokinase [Gammaproteobacteria bacterium]|nr:MAG: gluconokinase [Gammaproteobacteria bacterium]RTZ69615.1 MAG: gluconokinase [Aquificaceae bacterium]
MELINYLLKKLDGKLIQTHVSWVIIPSDRSFVLKIKKPVNFGFLDYSTLEKRKLYCQKEVELNRRLCRWVYLGVIPISKKGEDYILGSEENVCEYAVKMRYIDPERLLINRLNTLSEEDIKLVAQRVAQFHKKVPTFGDFGKPEVIKYNTDENFEQTKPFVGVTIDRETYEGIKERTERFYRDFEKLFLKRVEEGKIRDGHGDIRLEHVAFLPEGVCIFDCIEFNERFRYGDIINDMCFLSMELDLYGRSDLAKVYEETYKELMGEKDEEFYPLLNFYKAYRAYVRGKVTSFLLNDEGIPPQEKEQIKEKAKRFFQLSLDYLKRVYP